MKLGLHLPEVNSKRSYSSLDPLDSRYYDTQVAKYLSESSRIAYQAYVESALAQTLAQHHICSQAVADQICTAAAHVKAEAVYKEEQATKHDIKALVNCIKANLPPAAQPYVHFGATSYDIIATANALQMRDVCQQVVVPRLKELLGTLANLAQKYADTIQIGRTHGQHAVPVTFGFAIAEYLSRLGTSTEAIQALSNELTGKFSGAVGAYNALSIFINDPLKFETDVLKQVGLQPANYSTQIIPAEGMVRLIDEMAIAAGIMANLGHDMRHLQRTEIAEVRERFEAGQTGSSTMAHKRNPWNFENVVSMSKQIIAQTVNANLNLSSEHQRDLTDSASSRFYAIVPASLASMTKRLNTIMSKLEVDPAAMQRNLQLTGGAIAAEPLYLLFEKYGHTKAHEMAKQLAHRAGDLGQPLMEVILQDAKAKAYWQQFTAAEKAIITAPHQHYTGLAAQKTHQLVKQWTQQLKI
jgi:adenylosuccinate lyase